MATSNPFNVAHIETGTGTEALVDVSMDHSHPLPQQDDVEKKKSLIREEILGRLRWNVLAPPSTVEVVDFDTTGELCWRPLLLDPKHPLAHEAVTELPQSRMAVVLAMIEYWDCLGMMDEAPPPLLIENTDGQAVTIEQFVIKVSEYAQSLRQTIYDIENRYPSSQRSVDLYYDSTDAPEPQETGEPDFVFPLHLISKDTSLTGELETEWIRREREFAKTFGG